MSGIRPTSAERRTYSSKSHAHKISVYILYYRYACLKRNSAKKARFHADKATFQTAYCLTTIHDGRGSVVSMIWIPRGRIKSSTARGYSQRSYSPTHFKRTRHFLFTEITKLGIQQYRSTQYHNVKTISICPEIEEIRGWAAWNARELPRQHGKIAK